MFFFGKFITTLTWEIKVREWAKIADAVSTVPGIHCVKAIKEQPYGLNTMANSTWQENTKVRLHLRFWQPRMLVKYIFLVS